MYIVYIIKQWFNGDINSTYLCLLILSESINSAVFSRARQRVYKANSLINTSPIRAVCDHNRNSDKGSKYYYMD